MNFSDFSKKLFDDRKSVMKIIDPKSLSGKEKIVYERFFIKNLDISSGEIEILQKIFNKINQN